MRTRIRSLAVLAFLLLAIGPALSAARLPAPVTFGVYLLGQRSGQAKVTVTDTEFEGKPAVRVDSDTRLKLAALGEIEQTILTQQYLTPHGNPLFMRTEVSALGRKTVINARYFPDRVECDVDASGQVSKKTVPIPKGVALAGDKDFDVTGAKAPKIGEKETSWYFEPTSLSIQRMETEVLRREKLKVGKRTYDTFVIRAVDAAAGETTEWVDEKGDLIQTVATVGLKMVREEPGDAVAEYSPPADFLSATSVRTERKIQDPRSVHSLKVRISGVPAKELVLSDTRQRATASGAPDRLTVVYEVTAPDPPTHGARTLPAAPDNPFLADAPYLGITEPEIQRQAKQIAGSDTDRAVIARKIREWVHQHIDKPGNAGLLRSAKEIMANRDGVCREYATLFAALARAAGVPTRLCGGILFYKDGFYYHAWDECQLTDSPDGWCAFDATLPTDFVDATHLKFSQGDVTDMFGATRVIGLLKAQILAYR